MMELKPFQKEAVEKMTRFLKERDCVYNASEMGLGKTVQAISAINTQNTLIICPSVVKYVWEAEIRKWNKSRPYVCVINSSKEGYTQSLSHERSFIIVSYDLAAKNPEYYGDACHNGTLILDEAHYLKNHKAKRTKAILTHIWPKAKYKICLSGTPFTQSIMDCWPIFSRMSPEDFGDYWKFAHTYCNVQKTPFGIKFSGIRNHEKLRKIINDKFFFRYKKEDVLKELPPKVWQKIPLGPEYLVKMTKEETEAHEKYLDLLKDSYAKGVPIKAVPPIAVATMRKAQGIKKVPAIADFCKNLLDAETPIVVFAYHLDVIKELSQGLKAYGPVVITGETKAEDRQKAVEAFQNGITNVFIGQISASGIGITLTRSSTVLFGEFDWSPATVSQAVDRCHRIGQRDSVTVYFFSVLGSIDERIADAVVEKSKTFNKVLE